MLNRHKSLIARVLAEGTGAAITVKPFVAGGRQGLRMWFDDLDEKHGPIAELKPHGLLTHRVKLTFGLFSSRVIDQIAAAQVEELGLARALVRSAAIVSDLTISGQALDSWSVTSGSFEIIADYRHQNLVPDSDEAVVITCSEIIVPLMAAMAELIGYDQVENPADSNVPEVEGGLSQATVSRRERNPRSRLLCLRIHGHVCKACGLEPSSIYGEAGGIIEVHHLEPVSMLEKPRPYDPESDLVPLCPNCHRAVHTRRPWPLSPVELSRILESFRA